MDCKGRFFVHFCCTVERNLYIDEIKKPFMSLSNTQMQHLENKVWKVIDDLRGQISIEQICPIVGLLFVLKKDGLLQNLAKSKPNDQLEALYEITHQARTDQQNTLSNVFHSVRRSLENMGHELLASIVETIDSIEDDIFIAHSAQLFDELLYKVAKSSGKRGAEFIQPAELSQVIRSIANLRPEATIYNPFAGVASFALISDNAQYLGQEINAETWALAQLRLWVHGKEEQCVLLNGDSIRNWNPNDAKYDLIVSNPPFAMRIDDVHIDMLGNVRTVEQFFIPKALEDVKSNGKIIAVHTHGFLFKEGIERRVRQFLIEQDYLEMVISLPGRLFSSTSIPVCLVVINKNKAHKGFVRFIDGSALIIGKSTVSKTLDQQSLVELIHHEDDSEIARYVENKEVEDNDYNLSVARYFNIDKRINLVRLYDLELPFKLARSKVSGHGRYARIRDLSDSKISYHLNSNDLELTEIPKGSFEVSESVLLLATRWNTLKPTYFSYTGESIFINSDITALKIDTDKVDIGYLINELNSEGVRASVSSLSVGAVVSTIRKADLLTIGIELLPLEEQRAKVKGIAEAYFSEKRKELELEARIHGLESELYEQNAFLRHSLAGPSSNVTGSANKLRKILVEKVLPVMPEVLELKVGALSKLTLGSYLDILIRDTQKISDLVSNRTKTSEFLRDASIYRISIVHYLRQYFSELQSHKGYVVEFDIDHETFVDDEGNELIPQILGNEQLLSSLLDNLVANAEKHAFFGNKNNSVYALVGVNPPAKPGEQKQFFIMVSNSGAGFPENYSIEDFVRKGSRGTDRKGDGYGGWLINEIVQKMGGNIELWNPGISDFPTTFSFTFPIIQLDQDETI